MVNESPTTDLNWTIGLQFENNPEILRISIKNEVLLGRTSQAESAVVDLSEYGATDQGVSRKHAMIKWEGPHLMLYDMGSGNGTILNDTRLQPNIGYRLKDGDQLYLGHMPVKVHLNNDLGKSSIRARRIEFDVQNAPLMGRGQRVLLVEDEPGISALYRATLEGAGFTVQICRDVVSAMRALGQSTPSLILLDILLPGVHGLELCRYVRRDADGPEIPIVVVSALTDPETIKTAMDTGVDVYMSKPVNVRELVRVVAAIIYKQEVENPSMQTKQLRGTASLEFISAQPRKDTVIIFVEGYRDPIGTVIQPQVTLGRQVAANQRSHVDLESYGAFDKGVSRVHARIRRNGDRFFVEDMESSNGTFVNGSGLNKGESKAIKNGDELRLGELRMHVYMLADTDNLTEDQVQA
ncbi:MAG TPA: FHA domain-containing protein [Aggregatilineales bacterium]|nr:FHA domain-containing protein [Aggregatilineales bacterium]